MHLIDIEKALMRPLPGPSAQYIMAPEYRPHHSAEQIAAFSPKIGAVMLLLNPHGTQITVILTLRKQYLGTHSGQMSFPGGKKESQDSDMTQTALRETHEEIGISPASIKVIGSLTELYIPPSNFLVYPRVGILIEKVNFKKQDTEVEEIVEIPLSFFMNEASVSKTKIKLSDNIEVSVPAYIYDKYTIWGATAIMMSEFVYMLREAG